MMNGEGQLGWSCEKWRNIIYNQGGKDHAADGETKEGKLDGHILRRKCLIKHVVEEKIYGKGRRGRRRK
jgi:hypothetical protein